MESQSFNLLHAIVDSIWVAKQGAGETDYLELADKIQTKLNLPLSFEGKYRWIIFLTSKVKPGIPTLNRYFGTFIDGTIKYRGIEARRRDIPPFIRRCQLDILSQLSEANNSRELYKSVPRAIERIREYIKTLRKFDINPLDLMIQKQLSKDVSDYENHTLQSIAARQLTKQGLRINPGETITFLIVDEKDPIPEKRVLANEFVTEDSNYDLAKYETMLIRAASTILSPLGYDNDRLQRSLKFQNHKILEYIN